MIDTLIFLLSLLILLFVTIVFALSINHAIKLKRESKEILPIGKIVEVDNSKLHVFAEGEKENTVVFLSGHGTSCPTLDFKPLWMKLVDDFRIVVVERSGYGWSETSSNPKDIDSMLEETRKSLKLSGEKAPFILFPHSMSGLEAIYWAQKYPNEVKAIIGLDSCTPKSVDIIAKTKTLQVYLMYFISRIGLTRLIPTADVHKHLPIMNSHDLSEKDKNNYLAVFYKSSFTVDMLREIKYLKPNASKVEENEIPSTIPMFFFISDEQEKVAKGWKQSLVNYLSNVNNGKYKLLFTSHYVHYEKSDEIAKEAKAFIKSIA